jgi:hypothetical protein
MVTHYLGTKFWEENLGNVLLIIFFTIQLIFFFFFFFFSNGLFEC